MRTRLRLHQIPVQPPEPKRLKESDGTVSFSLHSSTASLGDPATPEAEILRRQQRRFQAGHLFGALSVITDQCGILVACINEEGASPGFHLLAVFPTLGAYTDRCEARHHPEISGNG